MCAVVFAERLFCGWWSFFATQRRTQHAARPPSSRLVFSSLSQVPVLPPPPFRLQVLPLSLSVDFLRLVLAVVDDHARSQGQVKMAATTSVVTATAAGSPGPGKAAAAAAATGAAVVGEEWAEAAAGRETGGPAHATAACLLSVGDFPRLYNRPGAIIRKLVKACKGDKPSGEVG